MMQGLQRYKTINISTLSKRQRLGIICFGVGTMFIVLGLPLADAPAYVGGIWSNFAVSICVLLGVVLVGLVLHEGMHGLFFKLYTGKVSFGFKLWSKIGTVFYATSEGSLLPRWKMIMVGLAPQILTVICLSLCGLPMLPNMAKHIMLVLAALNLGGGCFDLYMVYQVAREKGEVFVKDTTTGFVIYRGRQNEVHKQAYGGGED